LARNE